MHLVPDDAHLAGPVTPTRLQGVRIHDANLSGADQGGCDGDYGWRRQPLGVLHARQSDVVTARRVYFSL
jgi:hypothetical protein